MPGLSGFRYLNCSPAKRPHDNGQQQTARLLDQEPDRDTDAAGGEAPFDEVRPGIGALVPCNGIAQQNRQRGQADRQFDQDQQ